MENVFLGQRTAGDIDRLVGKILEELGNPDPPVQLEEVRELLTLDKAFFSSTDDGVLREIVHRLKVAGKQIARRPLLLLDAVRKCDLRALWLPDRKRILIDAELASAKQRWGEAHEIGHSLIPWHGSMAHGDQQLTLSYICHQRLEAEANYAAGRLLFLRDRFVDELLDGPITLERVRTLGSKTLGNTMTSTLWRAVESLPVPCLGLVSCHPRDFVPSTDQSQPVRYFIRSRAFLKRFSQVAADDVFSLVRRYPALRRVVFVGAVPILAPSHNPRRRVDAAAVQATPGFPA